MHSFQGSSELGSYTELGIYFSLLSMISPILSGSQEPSVHSSSQRHEVFSTLVSCCSCLEVAREKRRSNRGTPTLFFSNGGSLLEASTQSDGFSLTLFHGHCSSSFMAGTGLRAGSKAGLGETKGGKSVLPHSPGAFCPSALAKEHLCYYFFVVMPAIVFLFDPFLGQNQEIKEKNRTGYSPPPYFLFFMSLPICLLLFNYQSSVSCILYFVQSFCL